ncbi:cytochrome b involved in lipid metabolism [Bacillus sp. RC218]|uniref:hypothetical protein n=1 Tax=Bacillus sp. RC218 TaxID=3156282 RepID=UPI0038388EC0
MLTQTEKLAQIAEQASLVNELSSIALNLLEDEMYTKEYAAAELVKIINRETEMWNKA